MLWICGFVIAGWTLDDAFNDCGGQFTAAHWAGMGFAALCILATVFVGRNDA